MIRCELAAAEADRLQRSYRAGTGAVVELDAEGGAIIVDLRLVAYIRRLGVRRAVGFAEG